MPSIVLIGPAKAGKTSVAKVLSEQTGLPRRSTGEVQFEKYTGLGYDPKESERIWTEQGERASYEYLLPFYAQAISDMLAEPGDTIYDLDSEFVAFEDAGLLDRLQAQLAPFERVVLLLPTPDQAESIKILRQREEANLESNNAVNDFFLEHPSNQTFAKKIVYTAGKTPEQTADEVIAQLDLTSTQPVILIGPMFTGKSTVGSQLSRKLNRNQAPLDVLRWNYYKEIGYDDEKAGEIYKKDKFFGLFLYSQPYHAHAVERVLADYPDSIIDFGAGHSVYPDATLLERVRNVLAPYPNIVLILPSPDLAEAKQILRERFFGLMAQFYDLHEGFTRSGVFQKLAKQTVYTQDKTPQEVAAEILGQVAKSQPD